MKTTEKGHGRIEVRRLQSTTLLNDYVEFPFVSQVFKITRSRLTVKTGKETTETVFGITSQTPNKAPEERLLAQTRKHWSIENKLHYVRDWVYDEDRSTIRAHNGPAMMASMRNLALSLLRLDGITKISEATRYNGRKATRALKYLGV